MRISRRVMVLGVMVGVLGLVPAGVGSAGVDADAKADVFFANNADNGARNRICLGDGSGEFICGDVGSDSVFTVRVAAGDLNDDGFVDAVFVNPDGRNRTCLSSGDGEFVCSDVNTETGFASVALGYFDGDQELDAVFAGFGRTSRMCSGNGSGGFSCSDVSGDVFDSNDMTAGDVNNDGDLDVVFSNVDQRNRVCLGNGSGGFACSDVSTDTNGSADVALGDANNDGNLDAVFANEGKDRVCLGNGSGTFICHDLGPDASNTGDVAVGDMDEDGNLDAVLSKNGREQLCLGDGAGQFGCGDLNTDTNPTPGAAVADFNRDGHLDAVFAHWGAQNQVCLGSGSGQFSCSSISGDTNQSLAVAVAPAKRFADTNGNIFENDIEWLAGEGITKGCGSDLFCPNDYVTRGQMAAFLVRALGYTDDGGGDLFIDDDNSIFERDIDRLGTAGVTKGCNPPVNDRFCPDALVTRGAMAAFLVRALGYIDNGGGDLFIDDDGSIFENDIDRLATAGVTKGCNPPTNDRFCPNAYVTRGAMAAFLHRALG